MNVTSTQWYALYVKSRHEFNVQSELGRKGVEVFLPAVTRVRQWKDRSKQVSFPVFPGYLFVNILPKAEEFLTVLKTHGVVHLLSAQKGNPTPIPDPEMNSLKMLFDNSVEFDIFPHLKEGTRVRVKSGLLKGAEGIIRKKEGQYLLHIGVEILGRSIGVKMSVDDVEKV